MSAKATSVKSSTAFDAALIATDRGTGALGGRSSPRSSAPCSPLRCERDEFRRSNKFLLPAKANVSSQLESAESAKPSHRIFQNVRGWLPSAKVFSTLF